MAGYCYALCQGYPDLGFRSGWVGFGVQTDVASASGLLCLVLPQLRLLAG